MSTERPPYKRIARLLKEGNVIPFLGAGINYGTRQPPDAKWDANTLSFLPSGAELSRFLADWIDFPSDDERDLSDLAKVSSYLVESSARLRLREKLQEVFVGNEVALRRYEPSSIHNYLAEIARKSDAEIAGQPADRKEPGRPLLIVTTNYDNLTEEAFKRRERPFDLVVYPADRKDIAASLLWWKHDQAQPEAVTPNKLYINLEKTNVIYKMHGSIDPQGHLGNYVITEEDYINFLSRMTTQTAVPAQFIQYFRTRHFLFLGYGLNDWNWRVVLKNLRSAPAIEKATDEAAQDGGTDRDGDTEDIKSWAIQYRPSELEVALWEARNVKIYNQEINQFADGLRREA